MLDTILLGNKIKELRKGRGLTQTAFADELSVTFQAVSNWERGIAPPDIENLLRIAEFFGVLVDDLIRPVSDKVVLGIDGGGTKTEFVVADLDGTVKKRFIRKGTNPNDIGISESASIIIDGIRDVMLEFPSLSAVFCGIAGAASGENKQKLTEKIKEKYPSLTIDLNTDSANLFAMDDDADMAVISGTGSVVFVKQGNSFVGLGGWGYLLDDAGSAYDMGRDALRIALAEEDADIPYSTMSQLLREKLSVERVRQAIGKIYEGGRSFIASLSRIVFEAYDKGDTNAAAIIDKNAARLGELLELGTKRYGVRPKAIAGGGIFEHNTEIMLSHLRKYTDTEIIICRLPQVFGACRRARRSIDKKIPDKFFENFKKSYEGEIK